MAIRTTVTTDYGEDRELYIRLNNAEVSNHNAASHALFRGYISEDAFKGGKKFVWEHELTFAADVTRPIWEQAYQALVSAGVVGEATEA